MRGHSLASQRRALELAGAPPPARTCGLRRALVILAMAVLLAWLDSARAASGIEVDWPGAEGERLLDALRRVSAATDLRIVEPRGSDILATLPAPPVAAGRHDLQDLLQALFADSGLDWRIDADGDLVISLRTRVAAPTVEITATPLLDEVPVRVGARAEGAPGTTAWRPDQLGDWPDLDWQQLLRYAPNVSGQGANLTLRGVGLGRGAATAASVYLDGMPLPLSVIDADAVPLAGIDRIEFRRGPRSPWEGASTLGGSIDLATRRPAPDGKRRAGLSASDDGGLRLLGEWESGVGSKGLGARLSVESRQGGGFIEHVPGAQRAIDRQRLHAGLLKLSWEPDHVESLSVRARLLGIGGDPGQPLLAPGNPAQEGFDPFARRSFDPFTYRRRLHSGGSAVDIEWRASDRWQAWGHLAWGEASERADLALIALPSERQRSREREGRGLLSSGLAWLPGGGWRLALAAERQRRRFDSAEASLSDVRDFFPPALDVAVEPATDRIVEGRVITRITSSSLAFDLRRDGDAWTLEGGLRLLDERLLQTQSLRSFLSPPGCTIRIGSSVIDCADEFPARSLREDSRSDSVIRLPHARAEWRPHAAHRLALGYRRGYLSGGTQFNILRGDFDVYAPERSASLDLAWHWQHSRFESTLTLFANRWRDRQIPIALPQAGNFLIGNAGRASARGAEWLLRGPATETWRWHLGFGHLATRFDSFALAQGFDVVDLAGKRFPEAPRRTLVAGIGWRGERGLYASLGGRYSSAVFSDPANRAAGYRGGHAVFDAVLGWRSAGRHLYLAVDNLADRDYLRGLQLVAGQPVPRFYRPAPPRILRLGLQLDW